MSVNSNKNIDNTAKATFNSDRGKSGFFACKCCIMKFNESDYEDLGNNIEYICRWRYFMKWFCGLGTVALVFGLVIAFAVYLPAVAQSSMDNAQLIQMYMSMIEPTNNSITLNSTMQIVNSGVYQATLHSCAATLLYRNQKIGTFTQPSISIAAGTGATFALETPIIMDTDKGIKLFRNMSAEILLGHDVTVSFKAKPKLSPYLMGIKLPSVEVTMNKELVIAGALMQNAYIRNITNMSGTATGIDCDTEIEFSIATPFHLFGPTIEVNLFDVWNNQLGYAVIKKLKIVPGYNILKPIKTHMMFCHDCSNTSSWNNASVMGFLTSYESGLDQVLNMRGPTGGLVIAGTMNSDARVFGYCSPPS